MNFSNVNVLYKEKVLLKNRKENEVSGGIFSSINNFLFYPRNSKYKFSFYVPEYIYLRSVSLCEEIEEEIEKKFTVSDLARILYIDFVEYIKRTNDIHNVHTRLKARSLTPTAIKPFNTDDVYEGVIFEEHRGFEIIETRIEHKKALRCELLLKDMLEIYTEHNFILENILEIVFCDFINDYRKSLIKNPVGKVIQYI